MGNDIHLEDFAEFKCDDVHLAHEKGWSEQSRANFLVISDRREKRRKSQNLPYWPVMVPGA